MDSHHFHNVSRNSKPRRSLCTAMVKITGRLPNPKGLASHVRSTSSRRAGTKDGNWIGGYPLVSSTPWLDFFPNEGHKSFINLHITICPGQCEIHLPTGNQAWPAEKTLRMKMLTWSMNRGFPFQRLNTVPEGALLSPLESWINLRWGHGSKSRRSEPQCACISILGSAVPVLRCIEWQVSKDG